MILKIIITYYYKQMRIWVMYLASSNLRFVRYLTRVQQRASANDSLQANVISSINCVMATNNEARCNRFTAKN